MSSNAGEIVDQAYRWILGREADPDGRAFYVGAVERGQLDAARLRRLFLDCDEFQSGPSLTVVESDGVHVVVDPNEPDFGATIAHHGTWEPTIGQLIEDSLPVGGVFIDVGGNVGVMSFRAARKVGPGGRVFAFEPNPLNVDRFLRGVIANALTNVTLFPVAASDRTGPVFTLKNSNGKVVAATDVLQAENASQAMVPDDLLVHLDRIDLVKLDIEGFEVQALRGLTATLARHRPKVLCEFNPVCLRPHGGVEPEVLADLIFSMTGRVTVIHGDEFLGEVDSAAALMDLWRHRDAAIAATGHLPAGWTHFDLFFQVDR
ncbi:FkbM family methyltransferase [Brevundimonas staleyi]|uniref:FkbM family methyltransferase n=1 Tax=Brevundimonas staleyi TaxID=74326 RepID=A0ABW0FMT4_9CAUL